MSEDIADHFRLWLRAGLTGCEFAKRLSSKANHVAIELHLDAKLPRTDWLNAAFDANADHDRAVIAVFPQITTEVALVEFLNGLMHERWRVMLRKKRSPAGGVLVGIDWITKNGDVSETMGFAPWGMMPVTRRAPYVAIAAWPAGRANSRRGVGATPPARDKIVSFLDARHSMDDVEYEREWAKTMARVGALMSVPADDASLYRRAAFVIAAESATALRVEPSPG